MIKILHSLSVFVLCFAPTLVQAKTFENWLSGFKPEALRTGISEDTIHEALDGIRPIPRVIELDRKQPEGTMTFAQYYKRVVNDQRIQIGRTMLHKHRGVLDTISAHYGVPPQYIVALWGVETSFGENTGGFNIIPALATLAHEGRRANFFKAELLNALKIIDAGHISASRMKGSWAGAMGQNQFMPSSFLSFAQDWNKDGRRDIWGTLPDVFASTANYLSRSGWENNHHWGRAVDLPANFSKNLTGFDTTKTISEWARLGVKPKGHADWPKMSNLRASVIVPDGLSGPAFLAYDNYHVIMKWNKSTYFATSVGLLADQIAQ